MKKTLFIITLIFLLVPSLLSLGYAKPFYEGKVIKLIVTTRPGGGYDFYGRLLAKSMQKYLPGSTIIVKNIPGAGHIIGCNTIYYAKPDGLTFGIFSAALPLAQVAGLRGIKFDLTKMSWLGSAGLSRQTYVVSTKTPYKTMDELKQADQLVQAAGGVGSLNYVFTLLLTQMMGLDNIRISTGYHGGEDALALIRGEVQTDFHSWGSMKPLVTAGYARPLLYVAEKQPAGWEKVPLIQDVITEKKHVPTVNLMRSVCQLGRPFAGPPGIPPDRLKILQDAFRKALHDKDALKIAKKAERPIDFVSAADALKSIKSMMTLPPETVNTIKDAHKKE